MENNFQWKTTYDGRRPLMEDDPQWKMILNLKTTFNQRQPSRKDDLLWKATFERIRPLMENIL